MGIALLEWWPDQVVPLSLLKTLHSSPIEIRNAKISHYLSEKIRNTPFYIMAATLIWTLTDRHNYDKLLFRS